MIPVVIGIGGVTAGGKTTLCEKLTKHFGESNVISLCMDKYYYTESSGKLENLAEYDRPFPNWDSVKSVDFEQLVKDLDAKLTDLNIQEVTSASLRTSAPIVLLEGILVYEYPPLQKYFNLRYFITLPEDQARERRRQRSLETPDYFEPASYFDKYIWPSYLDCLQKLQIGGAESENENCHSRAEVVDQSSEEVVFVDGNADMSTICDRITRDITNFAERRTI